MYSESKKEALSLGKKLLEEREKRHFTQEQLSDQIGINRKTYSKYETGETDISALTLSKIASCYEVSTDYLLGLYKLPDTDMDDAKARKRIGCSEDAYKALCVLYGHALPDDNDPQPHQSAKYNMRFLLPFVMDILLTELCNNGGVFHIIELFEMIYSRLNDNIDTEKQAKMFEKYIDDSDKQQFAGMESRVISEKHEAARLRSIQYFVNVIDEMLYYVDENYRYVRKDNKDFDSILDEKRKIENYIYNPYYLNSIGKIPDINEYLRIKNNSEKETDHAEEE